MLGMCSPVRSNGVTLNNVFNRLNSSGKSTGQSQVLPTMKVQSTRAKRFEHHQEPINCMAVSRDGSYAVTGELNNFAFFDCEFSGFNLPLLTKLAHLERKLRAAPHWHQGTALKNGPAFSEVAQ